MFDHWSPAFSFFQIYVKPTQGNLGHYCSIATIYDIFMIEKTDYFMVQTFCLKCVLVLGFLQKNTEPNPFGYDLGNFVYNSI